LLYEVCTLDVFLGTFQGFFFVFVGKVLGLYVFVVFGGCFCVVCCFLGCDFKKCLTVAF